MTLYFEEEGDVKLPLECEALAKRVVEEALDYVGCPYEAEVNLLLTENAQIHEMNKEFRGIDRESSCTGRRVRTQSDARICFSYCAFCVTLNRL